MPGAISGEAFGRTPHETQEREVQSAPPQRRDPRYSAGRSGLRFVEDVVAAKRTEVAALGANAYSGTSTMPAYNWLRSSMPIACDVSGFPRRFVRPHALARFSSCSFVLKGLTALLCERPLQRSAPGKIRRGARCTGQIFTIRPPARPVNAEIRTRFVSRHISATFELRTGVVKAETRRVERSESLDGTEHSSILVL